MPLAKIICPACQREIQLDTSTEFNFCSYCGEKIFNSILPLSQKEDSSLIVNNNFLSAIQNYRNQNFNEAIELCISILETNECYFAAWLLLGKCSLWKVALHRYTSVSYEWNDCWENGITFAPTEKHEEIEKVLLSLIKVIPEFMANQFINSPTTDNANLLIWNHPLRAITAFNKNWNINEDISLPEKQEEITQWNC